MTRQLEDTIDSLRQDALNLGETPEIRELVRRIDAYKGHLSRQRDILVTAP